MAGCSSSKNSSDAQKSSGEHFASANASAEAAAAKRSAVAMTADEAWPAPTQLSRPWTRWWWMGSAVDEENITALMEQYKAAGLGGVEICPIYGVKGQESRYIDYLTPKWMEMLGVTTTEGKKLDMGVDMTTGTGWPMGGPDVSVEDASSNVILKHFDVAGGTTLGLDVTGRLQSIIAFSDDGQEIDLTPQVSDSKLFWTAPRGKWVVYTVMQSPPPMKVKRAAPGGVGNIIDPFSTKSIDDFLAGFDKAFAGFSAPMPGTQFHDSFEYIGDWTPNLFEEFQSRRGYDLRSQLPALNGIGSPDTVARVMCDYRLTMAELHEEFGAHWVNWAHSHGELAREQAHGAPVNLCDLYAEADIPETESFGAIDDTTIPMNKFGSSAAHVTGKPISSSESFTWLREHFQTSWADVKPAADYLMLSGVNHMLFHGMPYSPKDAPWPGWLFYASVNFNPEGGLWHDMPAYTAYATRCLSVLQEGKPSNDVLLYFPLYDYFQKPPAPGPAATSTTNPSTGAPLDQSMLVYFKIAGESLRNSPFYDAAVSLWDHGYGYDEISDRQLANVKFENGNLVSGGNIYHVIVVPQTKVIPVETMKNLLALANAGAKIVFQGPVPADVPGLADADARKADLKDLTKDLQPGTTKVGAGQVYLGDDLLDTLGKAGRWRETMVDGGLRFIRRQDEHGYFYFIANRGTTPVDGWVHLGTPCESTVMFDPMFADRAGIAGYRQNADFNAEIYMQLQPGESRILRTYTDRLATGPDWVYDRPAGDGIPITGKWHVEFVEGGPALPKAYDQTALTSWTARGDADANRFAGTGRYTITFKLPKVNADDWQIDLGKVGDSAQVTVNGQNVTTLLAAPFAVKIGKYLHPGNNTLQIDVTNVAANRIADLDRRGVVWRIFNEINFVNKAYQPFDASSWPLRDSGLLGPVKLVPIQTFVSPQY